MRFDFRPVFRRSARAELAAMAEDVAALLSPKAGGRAGGSLVEKILKLKVRLRAWGYVLPYAELGQAFWWLLNGATRGSAGTGKKGHVRGTGSTQEARPVPDRSSQFAQPLAEELGKSAAAQIQKIDDTTVA